MHTADWIAQGLRLKESGKYKEAIAAFDKVIEINREDGAAYYNRGHCLESMGRSRDAFDDFEMVIGLCSQKVPRPPYLADAYYRSALFLLIKDRETRRKMNLFDWSPDEMEGTTRMRIASRMGHKEAQEFVRAAGG